MGCAAFCATRSCSGRQEQALPAIPHTDLQSHSRRLANKLDALSVPCFDLLAKALAKVPQGDSWVSQPLASLALQAQEAIVAFEVTAQPQLSVPAGG